MKEKLLTVSQMVDLTGLRSQSIYARVNSGRLLRNEKGLFDILHPTNRATLKEMGINASSIKVPKPKPAGRPLPGEKKPGDIRQPGTGRMLSSAEERERNLRLRNEKLEIENEARRGRLLDAENVRAHVFFYLDRVFSNLERLANSYLDDVSAKIILNGELTADVRHEWKNRVLEEADNAKTETMNRLEKLSKGENV